MPAVTLEHDPVAIIEAIYDLECSRLAWLARLAEIVRPQMDHGFGAQAVLLTPCAQGFVLEAIGLSGTPEWVEPFVHHTMGQGTTQQAASLMAMPAGLYTFVHGPLRRFHPDIYPYQDDQVPRLEDWIALVATVDGVLLQVGSLAAAPIRVSRRDSCAWTHVAVHLRRMFALRSRLSRMRRRSPDMILDSEGRCVHAQGHARSRDARDEIRKLHTAVDRARGSLRRRDSMAALTSLRHLSAGRWSLVDRHDSDGRRYILAFANDETCHDPRALSRSESAVLTMVADGHSNAEIAWERDVAESTVSTQVSTILRKLRLSRREQLVVEARVPCTVEAELELDDARLLLASLATPELELPGLTRAEAAVATGVVEGLSDAQLAARRGVSARTIANQLRSVFAKLGVHSRAELISRCLARRRDNRRIDHGEREPVLPLSG